MSVLRLFGHPALQSGGASKGLAVPPKAVALLALLTADGARPLSRDWAAQQLWPDLDPAGGRANLRRHLHLIAKALGEEPLLLTRQTMQWNLQAKLGVDVIRFEAFCKTQPERALEEYSGDLCAGIEDEALAQLRLQYRSRYENLVRSLLRASHASGDQNMARRCLERLLAFDPFDEKSARDLIRMRSEAGDRSGAIQEYSALRQRLSSELGVEPEEETEELFSELIQDGSHSGVPNNLVPATSSFVGREREMGRIVEALRESRVVTLFGPGGIGKSRLAMRCCFDVLSSYAGGVWFVDLEHARSEADVWERIGDAAHVPSSDPRKDAVLRYFDQRNVLIVLDTCEHVLDAARSTAQALAEHTGVRVLATSRRALGIAAELAIAIPALDIPPAEMDESDSPLRYSACRLFVERAAISNASFRIERKDVASLSALLQSADGLPLAIELIASRANVLSVEGLRKRIAQAIRNARAGDPGRRNRTLFATLEWSCEMLASEQQAVFRRLGSFKGAFSLEDAESVCEGLRNPAEALFELVEASLVSVVARGEDRQYRLLETTRVFAFERLRGDEEYQTVLRLHALCLARKADALAQAPETAFSQLLDGLVQTIPDYLAALDNAVTYGWGDVGVRIVTGLYRFAMGHHFTDDILTRAVALVRDGRTAPAESAILARWAATIADTARHHDLAVEHAKIAEHYAREAGDEQLLCSSLSALAGIAFHRGRNDECERLLLEVRERVARLGDERQVLRTTARLGTLYIAQDYEKTVSLLVPAAERLIAFGDLRQAAYAYRNAAVSAYITQRYNEAARLADLALVQARLTTDLGLELVLLTMRGCTEHLLCHNEQAIAFHLEACTVLARVGESMEAIDAFEDVALTLTALGAFAPAARLAAYAARLRSVFSSPMGEELSGPYNQMIARLGESLGPAFDLERARGAGFTFQEALTLAREQLSALRSPHS